MFDVRRHLWAPSSCRSPQHLHGLSARVRNGLLERDATICFPAYTRTVLAHTHKYKHRSTQDDVSAWKWPAGLLHKHPDCNVWLRKTLCLCTRLNAEPCRNCLQLCSSFDIRRSQSDILTLQRGHEGIFFFYAFLLQTVERWQET